MTFHIAAGRATETNVALVSAVRGLGVEATLLRPELVDRRVRAGDIVLGRVDVLPTLDGVEACLWELRRLERHGARVLNGVGTLLAAHDKLTTALRLRRAEVPHPRTVHLDDGSEVALKPPVVLKPRFGSWGRDVVRCSTPEELERALRRLRRRRWFRRHGVLAQELIPPAGRDLRLLVARGQLIGAVERISAPGEWRTNVALGARRRPTSPPGEATELAVRAAAAVNGDLVGVDLLPTPDGGWVAIEVNGAVEFTSEYSLADRDVFVDAAQTLVGELGISGRPRRSVEAGARGDERHAVGSGGRRRFGDP